MLLRRRRRTRRRSGPRSRLPPTLQSRRGSARPASRRYPAKWSPARRAHDRIPDRGASRARRVHDRARRATARPVRRTAGIKRDLSPPDGPLASEARGRGAACASTARRSWPTGRCRRPSRRRTSWSGARRCSPTIPRCFDYIERCGSQVPAVLTGRASARSRRCSRAVRLRSPKSSMTLGRWRAISTASLRGLSRPSRGVHPGRCRARDRRRHRRYDGGVLAALPPERTRTSSPTPRICFSSARHKSSRRTRSSAPPARHRAANRRCKGSRHSSFDVIVAANVLHATRDLRATLTRVRELLAPGRRAGAQRNHPSPGLFRHDAPVSSKAGRSSRTTCAATIRWSTRPMGAGAGGAGVRGRGVVSGAGLPAAILGQHVIVAGVGRTGVRAPLRAPRRRSCRHVPTGRARRGGGAA